MMNVKVILIFTVAIVTVAQANSTALLTVESDGSVTVTGSKTEGALFKFLDGIKMKSAAKYNKVREVGFTSDRKVRDIFKHTIRGDI